MRHVPSGVARDQLRIAILNWRDRTHPEGGGSERYIEQVARGLVRRGHDVSLFCADHGLAPRHEVVDGVSVRRSGGRLGVYPLAGLHRRRAARRAGRRFDVVVDVQNGLPFLSTLTTRTPVVNLVHHVHREQWPVVFGRVVAALGWWVESRVAPRAYRGAQYVAVSEQTRQELATLGVRPDTVAVIHNGTDAPRAVDVPRSEAPVLVVLGRLVPHKRVEQAVDVLARLLPRHPDLTLRVIGEGWWHEEIVAHAERLGVRDRVHMLGFVDEDTKHAELARAWVKLAPSVKEGWGLCVVEAGSHGVPTVAFHDAGGLSESVVDGTTGLLARDLDDLTRLTGELLTDHQRREALGTAARAHALRFRWESAVESWETVLGHVAAGHRPMSGVEIVPPPVLPETRRRPRSAAPLLSRRR